MTQVYSLLPLINEAMCKNDKGAKLRKRHVGAGNHGHSKHKLSEAQVAEIIKRYNGRRDVGMKLAAEYGVSFYTIKGYAQSRRSKNILPDHLTRK